MKTPVRIAVTGAAGQIGYSLLFRIAAGEMLGRDQPVLLQLLELPIDKAQAALNGVMMELEDCAFPLLAGMSGVADPKVAFKDAEIAMLVGAKSGRPVGSVDKLIVWGNHSPTMYPDYRFATSNGQPLRTLINDENWNRTVFLPTVGKRGAAVIAARGLSSAASAANAAIGHMRDWLGGSGGKWVTMGIASDGSYGIPQDFMYGFPVTTHGGEY